MGQRDEGSLSEEAAHPRRPWLRRLRRWALLLAGTYCVLVLGISLLQRKLLYPRPAPTHEPSWAGATVLRIPCAAMGEVVALLRPAPSPQAPMVVHFHGNAEQLADLVPLGRLLARQGLGFLAVEYPGYGLAPGEPSEAAFYAAGECALAHLEGALGVERARIVLCGQSLGSGVAVELARRGRGARLLLVSAYTSMVDMAARTMPWLPTSWILADRFESLGKAAQVQQPALLLHGELDTLIPLEMSRTLAAALPHAEVWTVAGAGHNDLWDTGGAPLLERVGAFCRGSR